MKEKYKGKKDIKMFISYMEIYNENAYDLLDSTHLDSSFEKWEKVNFFFDEVFH